MGASDSLYFYNYDGTDDFFGMDYTLDTWFHIAWVHSNGQLKAYKNGVLYRTIPSGGTDYIRMRALEMGYNLNSGAFFEGEIDEVISFNRGLSAAEVYEVMRMNVPANMNGMTGYWQMSNCDEMHFYNPLNHIADSLDGVNCNISGVPDYTNIENPAEKSLIRVYPNPATDIIYIELANTLVNFVDVFDMTGRLVLHKNIYSSETFTIPVDLLSPGVYTLQMIDNRNELHSIKIVKD